MSKKFLIFLIGLFLTISVQAQDRLQVFVDCSNTRCDIDYFRNEINVVDFLLDRIAADIHILITSQPLGGGGRSYKMTFYGQNELEDKEETIIFETGPNFTDFERRESILRHLKIGLVPFLVRKGDVENVEINMKSDNTNITIPEPQEDPWNYWVFRVGARGSVNADQNYRSFEYNANASARRITNEMRFVWSMNYGRENSVFRYDEDGEEVEVEVNNNNYRISNTLALTISDHWSYGYIGRLSSSTFSNNERQIFIQPSIEYSIFPYQEVNNKFWTIRYGIDFRHNKYYEPSIFDKNEESLWGHGLELNMQFNQKWGNIEAGIDARTFFRDWSQYNLGVFYEVEVRVTGGLFVFTNFYGGLINDQFYLPRGDASGEEVLTRQRQLESSFSVWTNFGFNFRFGSDLSNFVNPRFR